MDEDFLIGRITRWLAEIGLSSAYGVGPEFATKAKFTPTETLQHQDDFERLVRELVGKAPSEAADVLHRIWPHLSFGKLRASDPLKLLAVLML